MADSSSSSSLLPPSLLSLWEQPIPVCKSIIQRCTRVYMQDVYEYARIYQPLQVSVSAPAHQNTASGKVGCTRRARVCTPAEEDGF